MCSIVDEPNAYDYYRRTELKFNFYQIYNNKKIIDLEQFYSNKYSVGWRRVVSNGNNTIANIFV
jgi:hypothetical protein